MVSNELLINSSSRSSALGSLINCSWRYGPRRVNHSRRDPMNLDVKSLRTCSKVMPGVVNLLLIHAVNSCIF